MGRPGIPKCKGGRAMARPCEGMSPFCYDFFVHAYASDSFYMASPKYISLSDSESLKVLQMSWISQAGRLRA